MNKDHQTYPFIHAARRVSFCAFCGAEITPQTEFCTCCGKKIVIDTDPESTVSFCTGCESVMPMIARFCPYCGKSARTGRTDGVSGRPADERPDAAWRPTDERTGAPGQPEAQSPEIPESEMMEVYGPPEWMGEKAKMSNRLFGSRMGTVYAPPDLMGRSRGIEPDSGKPVRKNIIPRLFGKKQDEE